MRKTPLRMTAYYAATTASSLLFDKQGVGRLQRIAASSHTFAPQFRTEKSHKRRRLSSLLPLPTPKLPEARTSQIDLGVYNARIVASDWSSGGLLVPPSSSSDAVPTAPPITGIVAAFAARSDFDDPDAELIEADFGDDVHTDVDMPIDDSLQYPFDQGDG